jgi:hypothetical protein
VALLRLRLSLTRSAGVSLESCVARKGKLEKRALPAGPGLYQRLALPSRPTKNILENCVAMPKTTDKTVPREEFAQ